MSAWTQFVTAMSNAGPLATGLAIAAVPVVAGIAALITRTGMQAKTDGLEADIRRLNDHLENLKTAHAAELQASQERYRDLDARHAALLNTRAFVQSQLDQITAAAADIALRVDAKDYSVLVPAPTLIPGDRPNELVFLCASGPQGSKLRSIRVPIDASMSGQVFLSGSATIASPVSKDDSFSKRTDKLTEYNTEETLSVCLNYRGEQRGVVQLLNRRSGRFSGEDIKRACELAGQLATLVGEFTSDPTRLAELGFSPRRNDFSATVAFVDLSGYSKLFATLDHSVINDLLNEYFEVIGNVAFAHNGVIDQFIGDGVLVVFGGPSSAVDHRAEALRAAREMVEAFARLRTRWSIIQYRGPEKLFVRIGLSTGSVTRSEVGHRQVRRVTVLGACVNDAARVCQRAPRGRDTVCVSRTLLAQASVPSTPISEDDCGVYELAG